MKSWNIPRVCTHNHCSHILDLLQAYNTNAVAVRAPALDIQRPRIWVIFQGFLHCNCTSSHCRGRSALCQFAFRATRSTLNSCPDAQHNAWLRCMANHCSVCTPHDTNLVSNACCYSTVECRILLNAAALERPNQQWTYYIANSVSIAQPDSTCPQWANQTVLGNSTHTRTPHVKCTPS